MKMTMIAFEMETDVMDAFAALAEREERSLVGQLRHLVKKALRDAVPYGMAYVDEMKTLGLTAQGKAGLEATGRVGAGRIEEMNAAKNPGYYTCWKCGKVFKETSKMYTINEGECMFCHRECKKGETNASKG